MTGRPCAPPASPTAAVGLRFGDQSVLSALPDNEPLFGLDFVPEFFWSEWRELPKGEYTAKSSKSAAWTSLRRLPDTERAALQARSTYLARNASSAITWMTPTRSCRWTTTAIRPRCDSRRIGSTNNAPSRPCSSSRPSQIARSNLIPRPLPGNPLRGREGGDGACAREQQGLMRTGYRKSNRAGGFRNPEREFDVRRMQRTNSRHPLPAKRMREGAGIRSSGTFARAMSSILGTQHANSIVLVYTREHFYEAP